MTCLPMTVRIDFFRRSFHGALALQIMTPGRKAGAAHIGEAVMTLPVTLQCAQCGAHGVSSHAFEVRLME